MPTVFIQPPSVTFLGECMIEMREESDGHLSRGYGGDVLNTAVYLSRLLGDQAIVRFTSVIGDDPFSNSMISDWEAEGIQCDTVGRKLNSNPGLYFVQTDDDGERSFHYWRSHSPARDMMKPQWASFIEPAFQSSWIYLSGITLAILDDEGRDQLIARLGASKNSGATIIFDGNFRPSLWHDHSIAAMWHERAWELCGLALAGAEDETRLFGDRSPEETITRLCGYGIPEIVIKRGADPILVNDEDSFTTVPVEPAVNIVDTTAAGDSFNAGYLNGRARSLGPLESARIGAKLAAAVIQHPGAIIPRSAMPAFPAKLGGE